MYNLSLGMRNYCSYLYIFDLGKMQPSEMCVFRWSQCYQKQIKEPIMKIVIQRLYCRASCDLDAMHMGENIAIGSVIEHCPRSQRSIDVSTFFYHHYYHPHHLPHRHHYC